MVIRRKKVPSAQIVQIVWESRLGFGDNVKEALSFIEGSILKIWHNLRGL
jgi:hypothetical protein